MYHSLLSREDGEHELEVEVEVGACIINTNSTVSDSSLLDDDE